MVMLICLYLTCQESRLCPSIDSWCGSGAVRKEVMEQPRGDGGTGSGCPTPHTDSANEVDSWEVWDGLRAGQCLCSLLQWGLLPSASCPCPRLPAGLALLSRGISRHCLSWGNATSFDTNLWPGHSNGCNQTTKQVPG